MKFHIPTLLIAAGTLAACGAIDDSSPNDPPETLTVDGKGDISSGVSQQGELLFGGDVTGEFKKDFEVHAYTISAKGGSDVRIDVTNKGTSRALDTNMFLYAPTDEGLVRIAKDDDSGFGAHSRIDIELRKDAEFLVVIKAEKDDARGRYRIALDCNNGDCSLEPTSDISAECPDRLAELVVECVFDEHIEAAEGFPEYDVLLDRCTKDENRTEFHHEQMCQLGDDEWCFEDFHTFFMDQMMPDCRDVAASDFEFDQPVVLTHTSEFSPFPMTFDDCEACTININSARYAGNPSNDDIAQSAIAFTSWPIGVAVDETGISEFRDDMKERLADRFQADLSFEIDIHLDSIENVVGTIESATRIEGFGVFDEEKILAWALHIPSEDRVVLFEVVDDAF